MEILQKQKVSFINGCARYTREVCNLRHSRQLLLILNFLCNLSVVTNYVNEAMIALDKQEKDGKQSNAPNEKSILQKLLRTNRSFAAVTVFDMFAAGIDSTVVSAQTLLYQLAINPEKQAKLQEEIFKMLPKIDSPLNGNCLNSAPYFRACLKEALRMVPTAPSNLRSTGQDIVLNGFQVPKMV